MPENDNISDALKALTNAIKQGGEDAGDYCKFVFYTQDEAGECSVAQMAAMGNLIAMCEERAQRDVGDFNVERNHSVGGTRASTMTVLIKPALLSEIQSGLNYNELLKPSINRSLGGTSGQGFSL